MPATASIASESAAGLGVLAGAIAVFGFIAQVSPALSGAGDWRVRRAVARGGLLGLAIGCVVIVLSAIID